MNTISSATKSTITSAQPSGFQAAFNKTAADRARLKETDLLQINVDVPSAVAVVVGALPRARTLRDQFITLFPPATLAEIDALGTYADALSFAQTACLAASRPLPPLNDLMERATKLRDMLTSDATALANRDLIDTKVLAELKGGTGYLAIAYDLGAMVRVMRDRWSEIGQRSAVQPSELDDAEQLYERITRAFAERDRQSEAVTAANADRARAYTLFMNAYDQLRRGAMFVRWEEEDADKYVPSLYAGRGGRGTKEKQETQSRSEPAPPPAGVTAPSSPAAEAGTGTNMPGGSPFATV